MGYCLSKQEMNQLLKSWSKDYMIYAPKVFKDKGAFSDTDLISYGQITDAEEIIFDRKSRFSFKEILMPISETLFYFTENEVKEADPLRTKGAIIFLRSCDMHAVKRFDEIYLRNGFEDYYYQRLREKVKFIVLGCKESFENCFCVSMGTNRTDTYDAYIELNDDGIKLDICCEELGGLADCAELKKEEVLPAFVEENETKVAIPEGLDLSVMNASLWKEYDSRCINCGRCNFSCPTCTCFTMQDIFYTDNGKVGERRRVWASCMVDGYTDVAGGGAYRKDNGQRMRFKVLHKVYDYKKRNGYHMCVGCGRCDDVCPEYISFSNLINRLDGAMKEVNANE